MKRGAKLLRRIAAAALLVAVGCTVYHFIIREIYPVEYSDYVEAYAVEYGVPKALVYAVIKCESGFDPAAHSDAAAKGLMQLKDDTFQWVLSKDQDADQDRADILDPETNIKYGTMLLKLHLQEFGSEELALAAYHAGRTRVNQWLRDEEFSADGETLSEIPFGDTSHYIKKVLSARRMYEKLYDFE